MWHLFVVLGFAVILLLVIQLENEVSRLSAKQASDHSSVMNSLLSCGNAIVGMSERLIALEKQENRRDA